MLCIYISLHICIGVHPSDVRLKTCLQPALIAFLCYTSSKETRVPVMRRPRRSMPIPWDLGCPKSVANIYCAFRLHFTFFASSRPFCSLFFFFFVYVYAVCCARFFSYFYLIFVFAAEALAYKIPLARSCCLPLSLVKLKRFIETQLSCAFSRNAEDGRPSWWWWLDGWMDGEEKKRRRHNVNYSNVEWCIT